MADRTLISVGVDVGTATTKIILSRLVLQDASVIPGPSRLRIASRSVLYRGRLHETPTAGGHLDEARLNAYLENAYAEAAIDRRMVESGGVIITGEAAQKENARRLAMSLANQAGSFVVATAGPHLEAILAARGSGAAARSAMIGGNVASVDIGGGTTNIAIFGQGKVIETACVNLGGRAVTLDIDPSGCSIARMTPLSRLVLPALSPGQSVDGASLRLAGERIADLLAGALVGEPAPAAGFYDGPALPRSTRIDEVWVSGGVGAFVGERFDPSAVMRFGDLGPAIGWALVPALQRRGLRWVPAQETTYATVIGVGVHSLQLSGGTIHLADPTVLPLTNIPVVSFDPHGSSTEWVRKQIARYAADGPFALHIGRLPEVTFAALNSLADRIQSGLPERAHPLVIVAEQDIAAALGLILQTAGVRQVIALDEVAVSEGSYLDIGRPLARDSVLPVVVKTLVFAGEEGVSS